MGRYFSNLSGLVVQKQYGATGCAESVGAGASAGNKSVESAEQSAAPAMLSQKHHGHHGRTGPILAQSQASVFAVEQRFR
jgi:hypothetical protein